MAVKFDPYHKWLGIPKAEQPPTLYRLIGVDDFEDDEDVIESAADRVMLFLRQQATGPTAAASERLMSEISKARLVLLDEEKRARYDAQLREEEQPESAGIADIAPVPRRAGRMKSTARGGKSSAARGKRGAGKRSSARKQDQLGLSSSQVAMIVGGVVAVGFLIMLCVTILMVRGAQQVADAADQIGQRAEDQFEVDAFGNRFPVSSDTPKPKSADAEVSLDDIASRFEQPTDPPATKAASTASSTPTPADTGSPPGGSNAAATEEPADQAEADWGAGAEEVDAAPAGQDSGLSAAEFTAAFGVFKDPGATEKQLVDATRLLRSNLSHSAMPAEVRSNAWVLDEATNVVNRVYLINSLLLPYIEALQAEITNLDLRNEDHLRQLRSQGSFDYRQIFPASGALLQYPGLNEVFWKNLARYEPEAIALLLTGRQATPNDTPAGPEPTDYAGDGEAGTDAGSDFAADGSGAAGASEPTEAGPPDPGMTFAAGDGEEKAREFLAALKLTEQKGFFVLAGEKQLAEKVKSAKIASGNYVKAHRQVKNNNELLPTLDREEAILRSKINKLNKEIAEALPYGGDQAKEDERNRLQKELDEKIKPIRDRFEQAERQKQDAYDACARVLDEAEEQFNALGEQYGRLTEVEGIFEALEEIGAELGPSRSMNSDYERLGKIRVALERKAQS
ncbi:MAG: hypothetical protein DWQ31_10515 [Planctomycetota bacterium]|nr:MAG: hypothetical protein DWQ31_10515 [Planctomycetota bacterium]REJ91102.1 MAG: hypothetical protein DWQ35_15180 [Planctomycetota bacterium]REK27644.1 MAG: hypothetical protein DWQ42_06680 [Planctomycetota bacterium]REK38513.1 MAG: hypothetical protein DWQ46_20505 [Planctomycetota bacterium]